MSKKRVVMNFFLISILILFLTVQISAATNSTNTTSASLSNFEKSYACLKEQVNSKINQGMTTEELSFSILALGYDSSMSGQLKTKLASLKSTENCWPSTGCNVKDTAIALLAYDHLSQDTSLIEAWLLNQTTKSTVLTWYLQIDSVNRTVCTIAYDDTTSTVTVQEDKRITGGIGTCFRPGYNGYWLEVDSNCYGKEFTITCDNDFLTSLLYKRKTGANSNTIFVSATTHTAALGGATTEKVESLCFKQGNSCDYESSLWASLALQKKGKDIKPMIPYLITLADDNLRYLPSSFLYIITGGFDEYLSSLISSQNNQGYWQISEQSRRYYDTAVALLSLGSRSSEQADLAKDYLLGVANQGNGCFNNNIRDTAFILYTASPKLASTITTTTTCASYSDQGYQCMFASECSDINGSVLSNFACQGATNICCNKAKQEETCFEKGGDICTIDEECSSIANLVSAKDTTSCCLAPANCQYKPVNDVLTQCEASDASFTCKSSCSDNEEERFYDCSNGDVCCSPQTTPQKSYWWIWLLVILIILVILAIIFRHQLNIWMFKVKSKFSKKPASSQANQRNQPRPPFPPQRMMPPGRLPPGMMRPGQPMRPFPPRPFPPRPGQPPQRPMPGARPFPKDKELDDTLKKLKDMGK